MKSGSFRFCSMLLVIALLINMLPMAVFAEKFREDATNTELQVGSVTRVVEEIQENRTEFTKEFLLSSGLHMAVLLSSPEQSQ